MGSYKIYRGKRTLKFVMCRISVTVNNKLLKHRISHSPSGFNWGYAGSGPADLALSILWDLLEEKPSESLYIDFKDEFVAGWGNEWEITSAEIRRWIILRLADRIEKKGTLYVELVDLQSVIERFIEHLKEEKEYYKMDIRYNLYKKIIEELEVLIEGNSKTEREKLKNSNNRKRRQLFNKKEVEERLC